MLETGKPLKLFCEEANNKLFIVIHYGFFEWFNIDKIGNFLPWMSVELIEDKLHMAIIKIIIKMGQLMLTGYYLI